MLSLLIIYDTCAKFEFKIQNLLMYHISNDNNIYTYSIYKINHFRNMLFTRFLPQFGAKKNGPQTTFIPMPSNPIRLRYDIPKSSVYHMSAAWKKSKWAKNSEKDHWCGLRLEEFD